MAKIKKDFWNIHGSEANQKGFEIQVEYRSDDNLFFYIKLPEEFIEVVKLLDDEMLIKYHIRQINRGRDQYTWIVNHDNEEGCTNTAKLAFKYLLDLAVVEKQVILVCFTNHTSAKRYNKSCLDQIGLSFELLYVLEKSCGEQKHYYLTEKHDRGLFPITYQKVDLTNYSGQKYKIFDDTPTNRLYLEDLYNRLSEFVTKLEEVVTTDKLLLYIENHVKLLE